MNKSILCTAFCFLISVLLYAQPTVRITGKLTDENKNPISTGEVLRTDYNQRFLIEAKIQSFPVNKDGSFSIDLPAGELQYLHFISPNHQNITIPFPSTTKKKINLEVVLPKFAVNKQLAPELVAEPYDKNGIKIPGTKIADMVYEFDLSQLPQSNNFAYRIGNVTKDEDFLSGPYPPYTFKQMYGIPRTFSFSTDYYHATVNTVEQKKIQIDFNNILSKEVHVPQVKSDDTKVNQWNEIFKLVRDEDKKVGLSRSEYMKANNRSFSGYKYDLTPFINAIHSLDAQAIDGETRNYLLLNLVNQIVLTGNSSDDNKKYAEQALDRIAYSDMVWSYNSLFLRSWYRLIGGFGQGDNPKLEAFIDNYATQSSRPSDIQQLLSMLLQIEKDSDSRPFKKYYTILTQNHPESPLAQNAVKRYGKDIAIAPGKSLPAFTFKDLDNPKQTLTNASLKSKLTLVDIWATWCGPCVSSFPGLTKVYNQFKDSGFTIFSISLDADESNVETFRKKRQKFPWLSSYAGNDKNVMNAFEAWSIPKTILVNEKGEIVTANRKDLEGENLAITVANYLRKEKSK